jgi:hypothetical protein
MSRRLADNLLRNRKTTLVTSLCTVDDSWEITNRFNSDWTTDMGNWIHFDTIVPLCFFTKINNPAKIGPSFFVEY